MRVGSPQNLLATQDGLQELRIGSPQGRWRPKMGLQELRAGSTQGLGALAARRAFELQNGLTRAAGWQRAEPLRPKLELYRLAASKTIETQHGLAGAAGWQPAELLRSKMGLQPLQVGSPQNFRDPRWAHKNCGLAARNAF